MPESLAEGCFIALYKNKGSTQDFTKYRFICLLNHAYKVISTYLLYPMLEETTGYLPESQAGFRKGRATRDNLYILTQLLDFWHSGSEFRPGHLDPVSTDEGTDWVTLSDGGAGAGAGAGG